MRCLDAGRPPIGGQSYAYSAAPGTSAGVGLSALGLRAKLERNPG
jgi:hypothetical protein